MNLLVILLMVTLIVLMSRIVTSEGKIANLRVLIVLAPALVRSNVV